MKFKNPYSWSAVLGAGILATLVMLPQARGELVLDNSAKQIAEDRESMRQALTASQKAQTTAAAEVNTAPAQVAPAAPAPVQQVQVSVAPQPQTQPQATTPAMTFQAQQPQPQQQAAAVAAPEVDNLSKSEMMRRERVREEVKNEDILQERLEELRLRDEKKRTDQILAAPAAPAATGATGPTGTAAPTAQMSQAPVTEEVIVAPTGGPTPKMLASKNADETGATSTAMVSGKTEGNEPTVVYVNPRGGMSSMSGNNYFNVTGHYAAGVGLGVSVSPNLSFELGYGYSEYGVALQSNDPYIRYVQTNNPGAYTGNYNSDTLSMKQNVFDANLKLYFTDSDSRIRPFIGAGGGYGRSYINLDQRIQQNLQRLGMYKNQGDYTLSQFLGTLSGGLDVQVSKHVSVGAVFKYYAVLTATENQPLNGAWFTTNYYGQPVAVESAPGEADKAMVSDSLSKTGFYSILAGATFSF